jgi:IS5 family transposase
LRPKINTQGEFNFQPADLKITAEYYAKYQAISEILDQNPGIVDAVHGDLAEALAEEVVPDKSGRKFIYTSDTILRIAIAQIIEDCSLRQITIRIDDSNYLRFFVRIFNGPMIDFTAFDKLKNRIRPETWKRVNQLLAKAAVQGKLIGGHRLRLDTTVVETNIHWPSDSSLLWDTYRTLARLLESIREMDSAVVGSRRLLTRKAKRLHHQIARRASRQPACAEDLEALYSKLIGLVEGICQWSVEVADGIDQKIAQRRYQSLEQATLSFLSDQVRHYRALGDRVINQTWRRIIQKESVPNDEKIFSLFEPHTELLIRGKAGKDVEFGHMIEIRQVGGKFITDYAVFDQKPREPDSLGPALQHHHALFGKYPDELAADKGYYQNMPQIAQLRKKVAVVGIAKKGSRTQEQIQRETDPAFRHAQCFRAGVEGTISFLKRVLGLFRCYSKGWPHYVATVGATILVHNLLVLARC